MTQEDASTIGMTRRVCLRLDNGSRIGCCPSLDVKGERRAARLDFVSGFAKGVVDEQDVLRISDIAGRLEAQRQAAAAPKSRPEAKMKDAKRPRTHKQVSDTPDPWMQKATRILDSLFKMKEAVYFKDPVKPTANFVPDYFSIITRPMDLSTVREKLRSAQFSSPEEFISDVDLIWSNAIKYNGASHSVGLAASEMRRKSLGALAKAGFVGGATGGSAARIESSAVRSKRHTAGLAPQKWEPETLPEASESKRSRGTRATRPPSARADRQEATSGAASRGPFSHQGRETLAAALEDENIDENVLQQVSDLVQNHMVVGEDGTEELDLFVLPDDVCWRVHDVLFPSSAAQVVRGPQVTGGDMLDEETDDE